MTRLALVVEDDGEIARFIAIVLREVGFEAVIVTNGRAALDHIAEQLPDMVVLDLNIPQISGVEVLRQIRASDTTADIVVIVVSANPHMIDQTYEMADLVLTKPVSYDQLRGMIQRFV
jgi:two-component system, OmpR family, KDP operon response regulator KdpE